MVVCPASAQPAHRVLEVSAPMSMLHWPGSAGADRAVLLYHLTGFRSRLTGPTMVSLSASAVALARLLGALVLPDGVADPASFNVPLE